MNELFLIDHFVTLALLVAVPLEGWYELRKLKARVEAGVPDARAAVYRRTMARSWGFTFLVLIWWMSIGRSGEALGFVMPKGPVALSVLGVSALLVLLLYGQLRAVRRRPESHQQVRHAMGGIAFFLPRSESEARWWFGLSCTAGVTEEILYRGFLIAWIGAFTGIWTAALLAGVAFGVAHLYQGVSGMVKTGAVGIVMGLLYVLTGNLWAPILLHIAIDAINGEIARVALSGEPV